MTHIHIHAPKPIQTETLWCPYCDEVIDGWPVYEWYDDTTCPKCGRWFGDSWNGHKWPKGLDIKTGELIK